MLKVKIVAASTFEDKEKFVEVEHLEDVEKYIFDEEFMKDIIDDEIGWDIKDEYIIVNGDPYNEGMDKTAILYDYYRE